MYDSTYSTTSYPDTYSTTSTLTGGEAAALGGVMLVVGLIMLVVSIISIISMWKLFTKAGKPGWAAIVPIYNQIVMLEIAGRPVWWFLLIMFVPFFGLWVSIVSVIDFVRSYQRSGLWVLGMIFLPIIALPMLAFQGKTKYAGPIALGRTDFMPAPVPAGSPAMAPAYVAPVTMPQQPSVNPTINDSMAPLDSAATDEVNGQPRPPITPQQ